MATAFTDIEELCRECTFLCIAGVVAATFLGMFLIVVIFPVETDYVMINNADIHNRHVKYNITTNKTLTIEGNAILHVSLEQHGDIQLLSRVEFTVTDTFLFSNNNNSIRAFTSLG